MHDKFSFLVKKITVTIIVVVGFFSHISSAQAIMPSSVEQIKKYDVSVTLSKEGAVDVIETINYDFGYAQKHGIFRDIPVAYRSDDGTYYLPKLTVQSVVDEQGTPYKYLATPQGTNLNIRIGDANVTVSGEKTYILKYHAEGVVSYFASSTELYWNAIGTQWQVPILENHIKITTPVAIVSSTCYTGEEFSTSTGCNIISSGKNIREFMYPQVLNPGEGITVVVGMPMKGIAKPDLSQFVTTTSPLGTNSPSTGDYIPDYSYEYTPTPPPSPWLWTLPIVTFFACFYIWWRFGREPKGRGVIIPEYEPPQKLSPIQVGTVIDGRTDDRDISAQLVHLAVQGFIKIKEENKDYLFTRLKDTESLNNPYEKKLCHELFKDKEAVLLSSLKYKFYTTAREVKQEVHNQIVQQGYLSSTPYKNIGKLGCLGWLIMTLLLIILGATPLFDAADMFIAWIFCSGVVFIFSLPMGRYFTQKGIETRESILGFKLFLSVTEKDRLKFHNAPEKKPELFEKYLPYAMVLAVEREWAEQFKELYSVPPAWFEGNFSNGFTTTAFTQHLSTFSTTSGSTLTSVVRAAGSGVSSGFSSGGFHSTPSSSSGFSGGSSGGGFGGGGGGSW